MSNWRLAVCLLALLAPFAVAPRAGAATTQPATTRRGAARPAATTQASAASLDALLEPIRAKHKLPGLVAAIVEGDQVIAIGAVGVRKLGADVPITVDDKLHLGSCTKAMTATMLARLVERKQLAWDSTLAQVFPHLAKTMDPGYGGATLEQMLQHRAGMPANVQWAMLGMKDTTTAQRLTLLKTQLGKPPESPPGTKYEYSNAGYAVATAMAEKATGRSWEVLIRTELFDVLGMKSAGFGPPGKTNQVDEPWGHLPAATRALPMQGDNPPVVGPSGRVHCTIRDWAKFVSLHLRGARGEEKSYLTSETFARLHTPPAGQDYGGGWAVLQRPWAGGTVLTHAGSNTMWYCVAWIAPKKNLAVLSVTNIGGDAAALGCDEASAAMIAHYGTMRRAAATLPATLPATRRAR